MTISQHPSQVGQSPSPGGELAALLARVEEATGPDRELDFAIYRTLNPAGRPQPFGWMMEPYDIAPAGLVHIRKGPNRPRVICADFVPTWTKSLDAALALVERVRPGASIDLYEPGSYLNARCVGICLPQQGPTPPRHNGYGPSLPLALLAALLRSLVPEGDLGACSAPDSASVAEAGHQGGAE